MKLCPKCREEVDQLYAKGWCKKCYKEITLALARVVEAENRWKGCLYDEDGKPL